MKMSKYKCGHNSDVIFMDNNPLSVAAYMMWKDRYGYDGDKSMCFECWCEGEGGRKMKIENLDTFQWAQQWLEKNKNYKCRCRICKLLRKEAGK